MQIAAISDIDGNLPALEATLDHIMSRHVDQIVVVGDVVLGAPDSYACWKLVCALGCPIVRGNADRFVAHYGTALADPQWTTEQFGPLQWAARQFSEVERQRLSSLPLTCRIAEVPDVLFFHATPQNDTDDIKAYTPSQRVRQMVGGVTERFLVRGHNHTPQVRLLDGQVIITCGSVGMAVDGHPVAHYLLLESCRDGWHIEHQSVAYDTEAALSRFHESGYLEATGPIGRLYMRDVIMATPQIVPFLRLYRRWSTDGAISLSEAVDRFLTLY